MNKLHIAVFTSRSFIRSVGLRPYLCLTIEKNILHVQHVICGYMEIVWPTLSFLSVSEFPEFPGATSFLVLTESSRKFRCSWSSSVATRFLVPYVQNCIFLPSLRSRRCVLIVLFFVRFPWYLTNPFDRVLLGISGLFEAIRTLHNRRTCRDKSDKGSSSALDFATILFSPSCSCILFAIVLVQLVKLNFKAQQRNLRWLMLNR